MTAGEQIESAITDFASHPPFMGCRHVVLHGAGPVLCIQHPAAGLLCMACARRHARRHDEHEERTCDECRREVDRLHPLVASMELTGGPVRDTKGHHRTLSGLLLLSGMGACEECFARTGRMVVDIPAAAWGSGWRP